MDAFSYLVTFISLIPALALTRVLGGLADLVQYHVRPAASRARWSALFVLWSLSSNKGMRPAAKQRCLYLSSCRRTAGAVRSTAQ
jgi:hypothetical protein